jgi:ERCC4-type nuclease
MTLPADYAALIAIAQADEMDGIKKQILDRNEELGAVAAFELLKELATRRKALAEERRKLQELWDATPAAAEEIEDGEEDADGG